MIESNTEPNLECELRCFSITVKDYFFLSY